MIIASDLRIGNKFIGIAGIQTVFDIADNTDRNKIEYVSAEHKEMYSHLIQVEENRNQYKPCEIEGVLLTHELLENYGFKAGVNDNYVYYIQLELDRQLEIIISVDGHYPQLVQSPEVSCEDCQIVSLNKIDYLHQLQNLYFALTGKELTTS